MSRLNARAKMSTVSKMDFETRTETLACGHEQFIAPHDVVKLRKGEIKTTVGKNRKCWTCE